MEWIPDNFGDDVRKYLDRVRQHLERAFESIPPAVGRHAGARVFPPVNLYETPEEIVARAEIPGVRKDDLEVTITGPTLRISGREPESDEYADTACHRKERAWGEFSRSVRLPESVDPEAEPAAKLADGILEVRVAKRKTPEPKRISVSE
jgi:HSP20 family protein